MKKEHDESKLPMWAQIELGRLRADLAYTQRKLNTGPESNTVADPYGRVPRYLGDNITVSFQLGKEHHEYIQARIENGKLYIMGLESISIEPSASNTAYVRLVNRGHVES